MLLQDWRDHQNSCQQGATLPLDQDPLDQDPLASMEVGKVLV